MTSNNTICIHIPFDLYIFVFVLVFVYKYCRGKINVPPWMNFKINNKIKHFMFLIVWFPAQRLMAYIWMAVTESKLPTDLQWVELMIRTIIIVWYILSMASIKTLEVVMWIKCQK